MRKGSLAPINFSCETVAVKSRTELERHATVATTVAAFVVKGSCLPAE